MITKDNGRKYQCPYCNRKYKKDMLIRHIGDKHDDLIPKGYTPLRVAFDSVNKYPNGYNGRCTECGGSTKWDENKGRYDRQCGRPECKASFIKRFESNMKAKFGYKRLVNDPNGLEKMLAGRKISGTYKFKNGVEKTYTGSYEKNALEFLDKVMNINPDDILCPGPILKYEYEGKIHLYITDLYYQPYNLIIEVKDGGSNPNNRNMPEYRAKQIAKEEYIIKETDYNYLRLTNNNLDQLLSVFMDLKLQLVENTGKRVVHVNEMMNALCSGYIPGIADAGSVYMVHYMKHNTFTDDEEGYGITDDPRLTNLVIRDRYGKLTKANESFLANAAYNTYILDSSKQEVNNLLAPYINEFVEEGFIYESIFKKKFYSYDQIALESTAHKTIDLYKALEVIGEVTKSYLNDACDGVIEIAGTYDTIEENDLIKYSVTKRKNRYLLESKNIEGMYITSKEPISELTRKTFENLLITREE